MPDIAIYLLWGLATILVMAGLAGTILPLLPGVPFVFLGLLIAAWIDNFQRIGWGTLSILALLTALAIAIDFFASVFGAQRVGASKQALWGAAIGSIIGIFFGLAGIFIFPFVGAVIGEFMAHQQPGQSARVGFATWLGLLFGALAKLALGLGMVGVFAISYFF